MLLAIRDKAQGWIAWVIVGFISIPFALWGIQEYLGVSGPQVVAKVGDQDITQQQLENNVERYRQQLRQLFGGGPLPEFLNDQSLRAQVLGSMIDDRVIVLHADTIGVRAGNSMVRNAIAALPGFQRDGRFDPDIYAMALQRQGMTPAGFESQIRQQLSAELLESTVTQTDFVAPNELAAYLALKYQQRDFAFLRLSQDRVTDVAVSDAAVRAAYDENPERFRQDAQVKLEYLALNLEALAAQVEVSEADVAEEYARNSAAFTREERRAMRHILFAFSADASENAQLEQAQQVRELLLAGGDFAALALEYSDDPGSAILGGDLGVVTRGIMVEPFEAAAFSLPVGEISEPVMTRFGYHLIEVTAIEGGEKQSLDAVREQIRRDLQMEQAERLFYDRAEQLGIITFDSPDSLEPAAETLELRVQTTDWLSRNADPELSGEPLATTRVLNAAFSDEVLRQGFNSDPIELDAETLVVVRVAEQREASLLPFAEVAALIRAELESAARGEALRQAAEALQAELNAGADLSALAETAGAEVLHLTGVNRDTSAAPFEVTAAAFALPAAANGTVSTVAALADGDYALIALYAVQDADPATVDAPARQAAREALAESRGQASLAQYVGALRAGTKIKTFLR